MHILKRIYLIALFLNIALNSQFICQTIIPEGTVSGTWTLTSSPYLIEGNITIRDDSSLTIEPGVRVEFQGHYEFNIHGVLLAVGTETDTITFTINDTTGTADTDTTLGGWNGFNFRNVLPENDTSEFIYCKIEYCKNIAESWPDNSGGAILIENTNNVKISNSLFQYNFADWGGAIGIVNSNLEISLCKFRDNRAKYNGGAIGTDISHIKITYCDFLNNHSQFSSGAINAWKSSLDIYSSNFTGNSAKTNYGAVGADSCDVVIHNTSFISNSSIWGGGLTANYGNLFLNNSKFIDNYADHGGGLLCSWNKINIDNVVFDQNRAIWGGGASITSSNTFIENSTFQNNYADEAGAMEYLIDTAHYSNKYEFSINNSDIIDNQATNIVGGIRIEQLNSDTSLVNVSIDKCNFMRNSADHVTALRILGSIEDFTISNSIFNSNTSIRWSASATFRNNCKGLVYNCLFVNNKAATGGNLSSSGGPGLGTFSEVDFMNCTFAYNSAAYGSAMNIRGGSVSNIANSIFWENNYKPIAVTTHNENGGLVFINYCDFPGGPDSVQLDSLSTLLWGPRNIDADPLFQDPYNNNFRLLDNSPCIGQGTDSAWFPLVELFAPDYDLEGNPRPNPPETNPDLGAYENEKEIPTDIITVNKIPNEHALYQNYPNPFNATTNIRYSIPFPNNVVARANFAFTANVLLTIYDILGKKVKTLVNEKQQPGNYELVFDASGLSSGIYFYTLHVDNYIETKKMILLR